VPGQEEPHSLGALLTYCCVDELEAAALIGAFSDMHWGYRSLSMPDSLALLQPNVELAFWLVDQLLYLQCPHVFSISIFSRLCNCLRSANLPLKETVFKVLTRIFVKWIDTLQQQHDPSAQAAVMRDALSRHLSLSRIQAAALRRLAYERRQNRLFLSPYVRSAVDCIGAMSKLQKTLADIKSAPSPSNDDTPDPGAAIPAEPSPGEGVALPQLDPPKVQQTSDTSLLVQWQQAALQAILASSAPPAHVVELEVCDRPGGHAPGGLVTPREVAGVGASAAASFRPVYRGQALHFRMENLGGSRTYHFRIRVTSSSGEAGGRWSEVVTVQTKAVAPFTLDRLNCGPTIFISRDNMSASFASNESWSTVLATTGFVCGSNYWEVHIDKSPTSYIFIGAARRSVDLGTFLGGDENGWGYIGDRALYHKRTKVKAFGERFGEGDTIGVTLDMDRGTLSFSKNGADLGVAFEGLAGELFPAVAFYNQGQRVSLVRSAFSCPGAGICIAGSPSSVGVNEVLELVELMGCMLARQPVPTALVREAHRDYLAWQAGTSFRCTTLCGYHLQLDTSEASCKAFGFRSGDRVRTPRGNATMMGVADGKPWFHVDGEAGAWFFSMQAIREGRANNMFNPTPAAAKAAQRPGGLVEGEGTGGGGGGEGSGAGKKGGAAPVATGAGVGGGISCKDFEALCDCPRWTASMDALVIRAVNEFCYRRQLSPWNLTPRVILEAVAHSRAELEALAREADHYGGNGHWGDGSVGDTAVATRFALLRLFNDRVIHALPFAGFGDALAAGAAHGPDLATWGLPTPDKGLGVGEQPRHFLYPSRLFSRGSGKGLGPMICALRGSVFMVTKERVLRTAIERTITPTKKAEDDYDYPEDLPQVNSAHRGLALAFRA
jgi:hypothetical protein